MLFCRKKKSPLSEAVEKYAGGEMSLRPCFLHPPPRLAQVRPREGHWVKKEACHGKGEAISGLEEALAMTQLFGRHLCSPAIRKKLAGVCSFNPLSLLRLLLGRMWPRKLATPHRVDMLQGQITRTNTWLLMQQHGPRVFIFVIARFAFCCVPLPAPQYYPDFNFLCS